MRKTRKRCFIFVCRERPERPEGCRRGPPPGVESRLEQAAASIPAGGLCNPEALRVWFEGTKEQIKTAIQGEMQGLVEEIISEVCH